MFFMSGHLQTCELPTTIPLSLDSCYEGFVDYTCEFFRLPLSFTISDTV